MGLSNLVVDIVALAERAERLQSESNQWKEEANSRSGYGLSIEDEREVVEEIRDIARLLQSHETELARLGHSTLAAYLRADIQQRLGRIESLCKTTKEALPHRPEQRRRL